MSIDSHVDLLKRLQEALGIRRLRTEEDLLDIVDRGLPIHAIGALRRVGFSEPEVHSLIITRRMLLRRRAYRHRLSRYESDRAVRLARVAVLAAGVFSDRRRASGWLRTPKRILNGRTPLELLATEAGGRLIEEWLYQIDDGMAA